MVSDHTDRLLTPRIELGSRAYKTCILTVKICEQYGVKRTWHSSSPHGTYTGCLYMGIGGVPIYVIVLAEIPESVR